MNTVKFEEIKDEFLEAEDKLLGIKRRDYAENEDCLVNFREVSKIMSLSPERYCLALTMKHIHSIIKSINSETYVWRWTGRDGKGEGLKQRISDARNYLLILAAILEEKES